MCDTGEIVYVVVEGIPVVNGQVSPGGAGLAAQDGAQTAQVVLVPEAQTMERQRMNSVSEAVPAHELRMSQSNPTSNASGGAPTVDQMAR